MTHTSEATSTAYEQALTPSELERARLYLDQSQGCIVGAIKILTEAQWTFKPAPDRWSIAEIVEHIVLVLERVLGPARANLEASPTRPPHPNYQVIDDIVIFQIPNRLLKFPSPDPTSGGLARSEASHRLSVAYAGLRDLLETSPNLRNRATPAPPLKAITNGAYQEMDGYQWILAAAAHTERHTKQVLEII